MSALLSVDIPGIPPPRSNAKVRQVHDLGTQLLIVTTDRISAFDVVMANGIPDKGAILNQMSAYWFEKLSSICPSHLISISDEAVSSAIGVTLPELRGRCLLATKAKPLKIECVARGYLAGSFLKEYRDSGSDVHGYKLPAGLVEASPLPEPIFTPATKAEEGHDMNLSAAQAIDLVGREIFETVKTWTLAIFAEASRHAASRGLILADTKFEFGETDDGLIWIDEALTPDSSRYWPASSYAPGGPQPSFDKQFVRDYLEAIGFDKQPPGPVLPDDVVDRTRAKYVEAFERVTGREYLA